MDLLVQRNTIKLIRRIADRRSVTEPIIPFKPQKAAFVPSKSMVSPLPRVSPESVGISSDRIYGFLSELHSRSLDMHSVTILRNGAVISESSFGSYRTDVWHVTNSLCKSITGLAIGMLIDDGLLRLETPIVNIFEKKGPIIIALTHRGITVRNLLTMSSGIIFNEAGSVTDEDWVKSFFESVIKSEPGKHFSYNSMNSYMLSAIVKQVTGKGLSSFLKERLFEPLGIENYYWETCPKGIEKGGWGLYILPEDSAKIGQLYLQNGVWNSRRIISEKWIKESTHAQIKTPDGTGDFDYGYQIWVGREQNVFLFNGMFGQNVIGFPDTGVLIITNAGNVEVFQSGGFYPILKKYFGPDFKPSEALPRNSYAEKRLRILESGLSKPPASLFSRMFGVSASLPAQCAQLDGRTYYTDGKYKGAGLLPLMTQVLQNNYTSGIKGVSFSVNNGAFFVNIIENDAVYKLPVGFLEAKYETVNMHGELYIVGVLGAFSSDEDGDTVLKIRFSFIETANSRTIKFTFFDDNVKMELSEQPGRKQIEIFIDSAENSASKFIQSLFSRIDPDYLDYKLERAFEPVLTGTLESGK